MKNFIPSLSALLISSAFLTTPAPAQTISAPVPHSGYFQTFTASGGGTLPNYCKLFEVVLIGGGGGSGPSGGGTGGAGGSGEAAVMCD